MENTTKLFIDQINNYSDTYFSLRNKFVSEFDIIDIMIKFAIMCSKGTKESWGDFQKRIVSIYDTIAKNKDEEMTTRVYSLFIFDSLMRNNDYILFMEGLNKNIYSLYEDKTNLLSLCEAFITISIQLSDEVSLGLDKLMDLIFRFYPVILTEDDFKDTKNFGEACDNFINYTKNQLVDVNNKLITDPNRIEKIKEELILSLGLCGEGPIMDKFFLTRGIAAVISRSIGLNEHEFFRLCGEAFKHETVINSSKEMSELEHQILLKENPNYIFLREGAQLISDTLKSHYQENTTSVIDFIMALLFVSMQIGMEIKEGKYQMIESVSSYFSKAPNIPNIFTALKAFIDVFNEGVKPSIKTKIEDSKQTADDLEIQINTNWFSTSKTDSTLN